MCEFQFWTVDVPASLIIQPLILLSGVVSNYFCKMLMQHVKSATKCMFHVCFGGLHLIQALCVALPLGITDAGPVTGQCHFVLYQ